MRRLKDEEILCVYDENNLLFIYLIKHTQEDIALALKDMNELDDNFFEDYPEFSSFEDVANTILKRGEFRSERGSEYREFTLGFRNP